MYPRQKLEKWDEFIEFLQKSESIWSSFRKQAGLKYEDRLKTCIRLVSKRHGVGAALTAFETHPDMTAFDKLVLQIMREIELERQKKAFEVKNSFNILTVTKSEVKRLKWEVKKVNGELKLEQERAKVARAELRKIWLQEGRDLDDLPSNI